MEFKIEAERISLGEPLDCKAKVECDRHADFVLGGTLSCRDHLWLVLMHFHRVSVGVPCYRCIPYCDRAVSRT